MHRAEQAGHWHSVLAGVGYDRGHVVAHGAAALLRDFIGRHRIAALNVAGSRESKESGIGDWVRSVLTATL